MTKTLYILIGIPGSGKSYWAARDSVLKEMDGYHTAIISRDAIRFSMLEDNQEYFANEKAVFNEYVRQLNEAMELGIDYVYADATHLNKGSRDKLLCRLNPDPRTKLTFVTFIPPVDVALERNAKRTGRARVPDEVIEDMASRMTDPIHDNYPQGKYGFCDISFDLVKEER